MNQEIIRMMKRRVDELTNEEIVIIRDYCNLKLENSKHGSIGVEMVKKMIAMLRKRANKITLSWR